MLVVEFIQICFCCVNAGRGIRSHYETIGDVMTNAFATDGWREFMKMIYSTVLEMNYAL